MSSPAFAPSRSDAAARLPARCRLKYLFDERAFVRQLTADVRRGLTQRPRWLPPRYFYDDAGSALFDRITALPEYYLTRAEDSILTRIAGAVARRVRPGDIVELGPGSCRKIRPLLDALGGGAGVRYVPVDVDGDALVRSVQALAPDYPVLAIHGLVADFERHLPRVPAPPGGRRLVLFLGSTIGNFDPVSRCQLLVAIRRLLGANGRLLLGVDLVKDRRVLEAAYDDSAGVTRDFNRNVLRVVNRHLGGDFRPEAFEHRAVWNDAARRIEMHLVASAPQRVRLARLGLALDFGRGDGIWTESSYKFTRVATAGMLAEARLDLEAWFTDSARRFGLALARPAPTRRR